jgi:hypothetical protein
MRDFGRNIRVDGSIFSIYPFSTTTTGIQYSNYSNLQFYMPRMSPWSLSDYYEFNTLGVLRHINETMTGRCLISQINNSAYSVTIIPPSNNIGNNAFTGPSYQDESIVLSTLETRSARTLRQGYVLSISTSIDPRTGRPFRIEGTGEGDLCYIAYLRDMFPVGRVGHLGSGYSQILCHELVHALRRIRGVADLTPMGDRFENFDEFCAVLVCNIYSSERHFALRADHSSNGGVLQLTEGEFFSRYFVQIGQFHQDLPEFAEQLAQISCSFNPLRLFSS